MSENEINAVEIIEAGRPLTREDCMERERVRQVRKDALETFERLTADKRTLIGWDLASPEELNELDKRIEETGKVAVAANVVDMYFGMSQFKYGE